MRIGADQNADAVAPLAFTPFEKYGFLPSEAPEAIAGLNSMTVMVEAARLRDERAAEASNLRMGTTSQLMGQAQAEFDRNIPTDTLN
jgi:hypothetical protein